MSTQLEQYKSRLREALGLINELKARLDTVEGTLHEPIAIIGMGCRFPGGGEGPDAFWQVLDNGVDAIQEIPVGRWHPDAIADARQEARWAGLLSDLTRFDASFFGISPREAESLDPQQRMLLEVTWEALEHAGQRPDLLIGSRTGVFVGICSADYQLLVGNSREGTYDAYCLTGNTFSTAAGRISFGLGFQGPAISIDTACSSSLVAIAEACQSLRAGDCNIAITGGVSAILAPRTMAMMVETQAISPDGRCKTLDSRANGYVRGEGCGVLVLKRLSDALRDGDRIDAVIRGWAVNQDGRSTGLTAPNVLSQQALLRQALERAKLAAADIGYVELHGTGTSLGDPIEAEALREVLGAPRTDGSSCILGAVKTNIGHLEGAAGVAGIIKVLLALKHEKIPKNLHFRRLNPRISLEGTPFVVPVESVPWPRGQKPRRAGVSSFGISGTNAHVILEEAPAEAPKSLPKEPSAHLFTLSAKTPEALSALALSSAEWFSLPNDASVYDIAYTASLRRTHHEHRLAVVARTREEFADMLQSFARVDTSAGVLHGHTSTKEAPRIVFVFPGQGSQWLGMGRQLLAEEPVFREAIEACELFVQREAGFSVLNQLAADENHSRLHEIDVIQPLLFALEVALAALWRSWGVVPDCVVGHSMGEAAAAHVAGMLSLRTQPKSSAVAVGS
jgi:acyl transferase domain-containing protein